MEPKRNEVGVIFTQYDELTALEDALPYLRAYIHFDLAETLIEVMPPVEDIMAAHRRLLPLFRELGVDSPPNPAPIHFNKLQAAIASAVLCFAAVQSERQLPRAEHSEEAGSNLLEPDNEQEPPPMGYEEMVYKIDAAIDMSIELLADGTEENNED